MPTKPRQDSEPRGVTAEWVRLRSIGNARRTDGCVGFGCLGFAVALIPLAFVVAVYGGASGVAMLIAVGSLSSGAVGLGKLLAFVGPRPRVWASRTQVTVGGTLRMRWEAVGRFREAQSIQITWLGREVAIERGYDGGTYRAVFATTPVTTAIGPLSGMTSLELPLLMMPSFVARNSRIEWIIQARVLTQGWPKADEMYLIEVLPGRIER